MAASVKRSNTCFSVRLLAAGLVWVLIVGQSLWMIFSHMAGADASSKSARAHNPEIQLYNSLAPLAAAMPGTETVLLISDKWPSEGYQREFLVSMAQYAFAPHLLVLEGTPPLAVTIFSSDRALAKFLQDQPYMLHKRVEPGVAILKRTEP